MGMLFVVNSINHFAKVAKGENGATPAKPISFFIIGILMINIPTWIQTVEDTIGMKGDALIMAQAGSGGSNWSSGAILSVLGFVQILGFVALVRGLIKLHAANSGDARGEGMWLSPAVHIIGGALAINIKWSVGVLAVTFAPSMLSTLQGFGIAN